MSYTVAAEATCFLVPLDDWDKGSMENAVVHVTKNELVFSGSHLLCDPDRPDAAGSWLPFALTGWYGFVRHSWVFLVRQESVQNTGRVR